LWREQRQPSQTRDILRSYRRYTVIHNLLVKFLPRKKKSRERINFLHRRLPLVFQLALERERAADQKREHRRKANIVNKKKGEKKPHLP
jgi:hypothetical protein